MKAKYDEVITIIDAPDRDGYTFTYWKGSSYQPGDKYTVTGDHTFTAQWKSVTQPVAQAKTIMPQTGDDTPVQGLALDHAWFSAIAGPRGQAPEIEVTVLVEYGGGGSAVPCP